MKKLMSPLMVVALMAMFTLPMIACAPKAEEPAEQTMDEQTEAMDESMDEMTDDGMMDESTMDDGMMDENSTMDDGMMDDGGMDDDMDDGGWTTASNTVSQSRYSGGRRRAAVPPSFVSRNGFETAERDFFTA